MTEPRLLGLSLLLLTTTWGCGGEGSSDQQTGGFGCTVLDCAAPGMPHDVCGDGADCVVDPSNGLSLCVARCAAAEECAFNGACADLDGDPLTLDSVCLPFCIEDAECRAGETCNDLGECEAGL